MTDNEMPRLCLDPFGEALLQKENPPEASKSPQNTVYFYCPVYQGRPSYCSCLHFLDAHAAGRDVLRPECQKAVATNNCLAIKMRAAEQAAGRGCPVDLRL